MSSWIAKLRKRVNRRPLARRVAPGQRGRGARSFESLQSRLLMAADTAAPALMAEVDDQSAIVFSGGWGASQYQYAFEGTSASSNSAEDASQLPVLLVVENQDLASREYLATQASLEAAGLEVVVAVTSREAAGSREKPDVARRDSTEASDLKLSDADASDYSAIVFVGGWGSSSYQYANETTY